MTYVPCPRCGFKRDVKHTNPSALLCKHCKSTPPPTFPGEWVTHAACASDAYPADLWHPTDGARGEMQANAAKLICVTECQVTQLCLEWALRADERDGVLGGMTPAERHTEQVRRHTA